MKTKPVAAAVAKEVACARRGSPVGRRAAFWGIAALLLVAASAYLLLSRSARPSLLLVTIDTLRADHVGAYGYAKAETPMLDGLAARGARFEHAIASVPLTGPSHATILTGEYPPVHGVRDNVVFSLDARHPTLATRLKALGYWTGAFVAAYPVAADFGFAQGFDDFAEDFHESGIPGQGAERPANEVADAAIGWLRARQPRQPFFLWLHFYDPHAPYSPPSPFAERFRDRPYDGEIAFVDAQLGRVLAELRAQGRESDTLVAALADHGESLGAHQERTHGVLIYEATLHIPLLLAGPGVPTGRLVRERVATVDLAPTLLRLLGAPNPPGLPGRDLGPGLRGERLRAEALYAESLFGRLNCRWAPLRALVRGDWKLIEGAEPELFELAKDPEEERNLAAAEPERLRAMRAELLAAVSKMAPGGDRAHANPVGAEQEERLRSLGYAGSAGGGELDLPGLPDPRTRVHAYERLQALLANPGLAPRTVEEAGRLAEQDPGNPFAQFALASLAYQAGEFARAERAFERSLELDPERPSMRLSYARLLRELGRLEESERQHRIALEQSGAPDRRTRISLAETLIRRGKLEEAETIVAQVLQQEPHQLEARAARGRLLLARGELEAGASDLSEAAAAGDADAALDLGCAYLAAGDGSGAAGAVSKLLRSNPGHPFALAIAGHALVLRGEPRDGLALLEQALAGHPRRPLAWLTLAAAFDAAGAPERAALCRRQAESAARS